VASGVRPGDRVAIMLEPALAFYAALFGTMKHGAVAVPLFALFGPDGVRLRIDDCSPAVLLTNHEKAAVIGVADETRGQIVKAFIVPKGPAGPDLIQEIQDMVRTRLSQHEYPRLIEFVTELPKTPAGDVNRKMLRERT
jgi:acyl-coenzyme A synthetase/AMP-(fatty) acid ligase